MRNYEKFLLPVLICASALFGACGETSPEPEPEPDAGRPEEDAGQPDDEDAGVDAGTEDAGPAPVFGGMTVDTDAKDQTLDLFGEVGHRFWVEVSDDERERMNTDTGIGGPIIDDVPDIGEPGRPGEPGPIDGDNIYVPGGEVESTFADHVVVRDAKTGSVADYGKIEVKLVGESTRRPWNRTSIPNLRFDTDEFQKDLTIGSFEHFRLNNGQVGSIYRELIAHRIYRALGYPGLRATYGMLGSNVWGDNVWIPMTLIEVYKKRFCDDNQDLIGGTCTNMWEFPGDAGSLPVPQNACQLGECTDTRLEELGAALADAPTGEGFKEALSSIIDWEKFHQFQCISWIMWTGDDALHNMNNNLIMEREDGKLVWAPYSVDISAGQSWYQNTKLYGDSTIAKGCQKDPTCWADAIAVCRQVVQKFDELNPENIVDEVNETLMAQGMIRPNDEERAAFIRDWFVTRQEGLSAELEFYSEPPGEDGCPESLELCGDGSCGTTEQCEERRCFAGQEWCETYNRCISPEFESCPTCEGETPFFCPVDSMCAESLEACAARCEEGYFYCEEWQYCMPLDQQCGGGFPLD